MINRNRQWETLKSLEFTRTGCSEEERKAAQIIADNIKKNGVDSRFEEFEIDDRIITEQSLCSDSTIYEVAAYKYCSDCDISAPFYYMSSGSSVSYRNSRGKIVLINEQLKYDLYCRLVDAGVAAVITYNGELKDSEVDTDLAHRELKKTFRDYGNISCVNMKIQQAFRLILENPSILSLTVRQQQITGHSQNVVSEIPGTVDEIITLTAHYDSVEYSKGVFDNGGGSVILLELYYHFLQNRPYRTLRFIWCGCEERGLLGSWAYVARHRDELEKIIFEYNIDVAGPVIGNDTAKVMADDVTMKYLEDFADRKNFQTDIVRKVYSSDNVPFIDNGIPAISFSRTNHSGGAFMHTRYDCMFNLDKNNLFNTAEFIRSFIDETVNSVEFPFTRVIPDELKKEIDKYLNRKSGDKNEV